MQDRAANSARATAVEIAARLTAARRAGRALDGFPAQIPATLDDAYAVQSAGIAQWRDEIVGWKVGKLAPQFEPIHGAQRLTGPIFRRALRMASGKPVPFPVFVGGFAAVEGEFVFRLGVDAPADQTSWMHTEALALVADLHVGVETAGSPIPAINDYGPTVIISDFGNNAGLILGPSIPGWRTRDLNALSWETFVDNQRVGHGSARGIGDLLDALCFLLALQARRERPLKRGDLISTGAVTGIHEIVAGQAARVRFGDLGEIFCTAVPAEAESA